MPTYKRFEDLPVWQAAACLYDRTDEFINHAPPRLTRSFRDQLERAALSVSNNIAEGFERAPPMSYWRFSTLRAVPRRSALDATTRTRRRIWARTSPRWRIDYPRRVLCPAASWLGGFAARTPKMGGQRRVNDKTAPRILSPGPAGRRGGFCASAEANLPPDHPLHPKNRPAG